MRSHRKGAGNLSVLHSPPATPPLLLSSGLPCLASYLFVSYFDDECFGAGQVAWLEPQPHPPCRLPPEEQQGDPCHHPDHDVIADNPPWTATVAAEPLWTQVREGQGRGRAGAGGESRRPRWAGVLVPPGVPPPFPCPHTTDETEELRGSRDVSIVRVP